RVAPAEKTHEKNGENGLAEWGDIQTTTTKAYHPGQSRMRFGRALSSVSKGHQGPQEAPRLMLPRTQASSPSSASKVCKSAEGPNCGKAKAGTMLSLTDRSPNRMAAATQAEARSAPPAAAAAAAAAAGVATDARFPAHDRCGFRRPGSRRCER
ncbi:hypothetical protein A4X06_0g983, partial [Tilletia controversa]